MLPKMRLIRQNHEANPPVADVAAEMRSSLQGIGFDTAVFQGKKVGIAVGSRGISHLVEIVRTAVSIVREAGGMPEIFAAMGCHGEASAAGQREMLASLGILEEAVPFRPATRQLTMAIRPPAFRSTEIRSRLSMMPSS